MLCCARRRLDAAREARARELLRGGINWDEFLRASLRQGVMPLVYRQLSGRLADAVPAERLRLFRQKYQLNAVRNTERAGRLCRLLKLFERHGVGAVPYKGPALAVDAYGDLTLRQFGDLDVLIRPGDLARATELLAAEGYEPEFQLSGAREEAFKKWWYVQPFSKADDGVYLELHWSVAPRFFSFDLDADLWTRLRALELVGSEVRVFSVRDTLLLLCVHGAKDLWARLEWVCALSEFVARRADELDWREAVESARARGGERMLLLGLLLARELYDAELPDLVRRRIEASPGLKSLASQVVGELFSDEKSFDRFLGRAAFHLRARERAADRARYCARVAASTSPEEWDLLPLPPRLFFLYSFVRPLRLARGWLLGAQRPAPKERRHGAAPDAT